MRNWHGRLSPFGRWHTAGTSLAAQVAALFGPSDTGWFYDNSDMSTMFQDSAGTIPVTAVGQPVGLQLDKSGRGNHRSQSISLNRPTLARHPLGGIRNRLVSTNDLSAASWIRWSVSSVSSATSPDANSAWTVTTSGTDGCIFQADADTSGTVKTHQVRVKAGTSSTFRFQETVAGNGVYVDFNLSAITAGSPVAVGPGGATISSAAIVDEGDGWRLCTITATRTSGTEGNYFLVVVGASGSTMTFKMPQAEAGSTATPYQRVTTAYDVTEAGVPDQYYLSYNGTNNSLATSAFDWGTDKATICAGVRKLSDAAFPPIAEFSSSVIVRNGAFSLLANGNTGTKLLASSIRGTSLYEEVASSSVYGAPISLVLTGVYNIGASSADASLTIRANSANVATNVLSGTTQGTGNFGTHPVFFGARGGTSLFFNGHEYSHFAINRLLTESELALVERYTNSRTGAY